MNKKNILIVGDVVTLAILTITGFATHGETGVSFLPRMAASFVPMALGWFMLTPWFNLFNEANTLNPKQLWRIIFAMLFIAPFAVILRAAWLGSTGMPLFALALGAANAFGMLVWRWLYIFIVKRIN